MRILLLLLVACAAPRPTPTVARTGDVHDFDFLEGAWSTTQRRLRARNVGSSDWEEFPATLCVSLHMDGLVNTDVLVMPTKGWRGMTLRSFDLEKRQWSIYWISDKRGRVDPPVVGGFAGDDRGEFYGVDTDGGKRVDVRYVWTRVDRDHARWEQAFSYDGRAWETNWTAEFRRADPAALCVKPAPSSP